MIGIVLWFILYNFAYAYMLTLKWRKILDTMINQYQGRAVGIETIAVSIGEEVDTIEDVYEPYLLQIGFIARTPKGRVVLPAAYEHLGYDYQTKMY